MQELAPIILFVYNRPEHTKKVVEGLLLNSEASNSELFIFADGPKPTISEKGLKDLKRVREYIHTISGFKEIHIDESDINRGLANATIRGCSKVINKYGRMIVMEDDDVPNKYFLSYINRCLDVFKDDEHVWCVSGYTDTSLLPPNDGEDLFFVNRPSSWGFGTWKRCWDKVIWDLPTLRGLVSYKKLMNDFDKWGGTDSSYIMKDLMNGRNSSWSIRYNFAAFLNHSYTILPNKTLIENIGCDGTGTHCGLIEYHLDMMEREVIIPDKILFDKKRDALLRKSCSIHGIKNKLKYFIRNSSLLSKLVKLS